MGRRWTEKEKQYIRDKWGGVSVEKIAAQLNRTIPATKEMARLLCGGKKKKKYTKIPRSEVCRRKRCKTCIYRNTRGRGCDYILTEGKRRGCSPEDCDKYIEGKKKPINNDLAWEWRR